MTSSSSGPTEPPITSEPSSSGPPMTPGSSSPTETPMTSEPTSSSQSEGSTSPSGTPSSTTSQVGTPTSQTGGCKCGVEKTSRIVGGTEVSPKNKYPWMVALVSSGFQFCGGSLVASKYVISAAHCMFHQDGTALANTDFQIRIGE